MFTRKPPTEESVFDEAIANALKQLDAVPAYSDEYIKIVNQIERFHSMKTSNRPQRVTPDTKAIVIGNLVGILAIVEFERAHVAASKALNFVMKASR